MSDKTKKKSNVTVNEDETYEEALKRYGLSPSKNGHYVDKAELYAHMVEYCEAREKAKAEGAEPPRIDDYVAECIVKIATHLSYLPNFNGYTYRQDFVSDAIENCLSYIDNFDPKKSSNPFAYFTQICWYAFIRRIMKEKRQSIIKGKLIMGMPFDDSMMIDEDTNKAVVEDALRNTHTFVELAAEEERKQKAKADERKAVRDAARKAVEKPKTGLEEFFE